MFFSNLLNYISTIIEEHYFLLVGRLKSFRRFYRNADWITKFFLIFLSFNLVLPCLFFSKVFYYIFKNIILFFLFFIDNIFIVFFEDDFVKYSITYNLFKKFENFICMLFTKFENIYIKIKNINYELIYGNFSYFDVFFEIFLISIELFIYYIFAFVLNILKFGRYLYNSLFVIGRFFRRLYYKNLYYYYKFVYLLKRIRYRFMRRYFIIAYFFWHLFHIHYFFFWVIFEYIYYYISIFKLNLIWLWRILKLIISTNLKFKFLAFIKRVPKVFNFHFRLNCYYLRVGLFFLRKIYIHVRLLISKLFLFLSFHLEFLIGIIISMYA